MNKKLLLAPAALGFILALASCKDGTIETAYKDGILYINQDDGTFSMTLKEEFEGEIFECPKVYIKYPISKIADQAFKNQKNIKHVILHSYIQTIEKNAFWGSGIEDLEILPEVLTIGNYAFYDCDSLTSITIPNTVLSLGSGIFTNCDNLTNVVLPTTLKEIPWATFDYCSSLVYEIPENITAIGGFAFRGNAISELSIPSNVKTIGDDAYRDCNNLTKVVLSEGVETLGEKVFYQCDVLQEVTLPKSLKSVGEKAFYGNSLDITYNGSKEEFNKLNIELSIGSKVICTDGSITI